MAKPLKKSINGTLPPTTASRISFNQLLFLSGQDLFPYLIKNKVKKINNRPARLFFNNTSKTGLTPADITSLFKKLAAPLMRAAAKMAFIPFL